VLNVPTTTDAAFLSENSRQSIPECPSAAQDQSYILPNTVQLYRVYLATDDVLADLSGKLAYRRAPYAGKFPL
jgi:hypothetical protein